MHAPIPCWRLRCWRLIPASSGGLQIAPLDPLHERFDLAARAVSRIGRDAERAVRTRCPLDDARRIAAFDQAGLRATARPCRIGRATRPLEPRRAGATIPGSATTTMSAGPAAKYTHPASKPASLQVKDYDRLHSRSISAGRDVQRALRPARLLPCDDEQSTTTAHDRCNADIPITNAQTQLHARQDPCLGADFSYQRGERGAIVGRREFCTTLSRRSPLRGTSRLFSDRHDDRAADCTGSAGKWTVRRLLHIPLLRSASLEKQCTPSLTSIATPFARRQCSGDRCST